MTEGSLWVRVPASVAEEYEVRVEEGGLARLGALCREASAAHRYAIIADSRVSELYGGRALASLERAGLSAELFDFPAGEWNKTRREWGRLTDRLLRAGYGRDTAVVALGGGVTGDLGGFVAATYMRGVPVVQVPTSLLAMVDSAVGGKVGLDTHAGKNLVGAFHHPLLVVVDPDLLATLPRLQVAAGLAEVVKVAAIQDESFFDWLEGHAADLLDGQPDLLREAVFRSIALKAEVVGADPTEMGGRAVLNFGHTVGHALELLSGYDVLHGEAVAAGLRAESRLGERIGITQAGTTARLAALLDRCGLERRLEEERNPEEVWEAAARDKKARRGRVRCVFLRCVGETARAEDGSHTFQIPASKGKEWFRVALRAESADDPGLDGALREGPRR